MLREEVKVQGREVGVDHQGKTGGETPNVLK